MSTTIPGAGFIVFTHQQPLVTICSRCGATVSENWNGPPGNVMVAGPCSKCPKAKPIDPAGGKESE